MSSVEDLKIFFTKIVFRSQSYQELKTLHSQNIIPIPKLDKWRNHRTVPTQKRDESKDKFPFFFFPFFGWLRQTHCRVFYVRFHRTFEAIQSRMKQHAYRIWLKCISLWNLQTLCVAAFYGFVLFRNFWRTSEIWRVIFDPGSKVSHKILFAWKRRPKPKNNKNGRQCIHPFYFRFMIYVSSARTTLPTTPSRTHRRIARRTLLILMRIWG